MANRDCLSTPNQLCAACAKATPTTKRQLSRPTFRRSVPAFHWLNGETIAKVNAIRAQRLSERRRIAGYQLGITGNRNSKFSQVAAKSFDVS
jgi:hypothetical protein